MRITISNDEILAFTGALIEKGLEHSTKPLGVFYTFLIIPGEDLPEEYKQCFREVALKLKSKK